MNKAYDGFLENDEMSGQTVECSLDQLYFRREPEPANVSQAWVVGDPEGFWKGNLILKQNEDSQLEGNKSKVEDYRHN